MSYDILSETLPQCDNTKSTNYGSSFEMSTATIVLLRCCKQKIDAVVSLNDPKYAPWDDLVLKYQDKIVCFQLKHTASVRKNKFKKCLDARHHILRRHTDSTALTFVYLTTASVSDDRLRLPRLDAVPTMCDHFLTNNHVCYDANSRTYFCTDQHNIARSHVDIYEALQEFVGEEYASKDFLRNLQLNLKEYVRRRFYRFECPDDPLTTEEIRRYIGYAFLSQFVIPYAHPANNHVLSKDFAERLKEMRIIVLDHRTKSTIKENIWKYLVKLPRGKHHLCTEWSFGEKIHMPLFSPTTKTDRKILRGMEMLDFECRVVILRPRSFRIDSKRGILSKLRVAGTINFNGERESLNYVQLKPGFLDNASGLHDDLFCKLAGDFNAGDRYFLEAHDESGYVNEEVTVGNDVLSPLIAVVKTPDVDVDVVEDLINRGANLNASVGGGLTALNFAVENDRKDIVELLLRRGARADSVDRLGNTPLFAACSQSKKELVELLLNYGSNRYKADAAGTTPIFKAYQVEDYEILGLLLRGNENPKAANARGSHILHQAALDGNVECLECVVKSSIGIDVFMTGDAAGRTPLEIAVENGHREFVELLEKSLNL